VENGVEMDLLDVTWCSRISLVEFMNQSWSKDITLPNPGVLFISKTLPLYEILQLASVKSTVKGLFDFVMFLIFDNLCSLL